VLPLFEQHEVKLLRMLTDRGSEFCGNCNPPNYVRPKVNRRRSISACDSVTM
jgi:hypothetical protein